MLKHIRAITPWEWVAILLTLAVGFSASGGN